VSGENNPFEKHARAIGVLFGCLLLLPVAGGAWLGYRALAQDAQRGYERHIVLRECSPLSETRHSAWNSDEQYVRRCDDNGFIKPSRVHDDPELEIVFLGASTTECLHNPEDQRFPYLAGRLIEERTNRRVNAYNGGKSGSTANHSVLALLGKVVPMHPDAAVLMHGINDAMFLMLAGDYWAPHARRSMLQDKDYNPVKAWVLERELGHRFLDMPKTDYDPYRGKPATLNVEAMTAQFAAMEELFVFICRKYAITPVLMTQFNRLTLDSDAYREATAARLKDFSIEYDDFQRAYAAMNETTRRVAAEQGVLLVDLAARIPGTPEYMYDSVHLTEKGTAAVADIVAQALSAELVR
jgi:lysophospholipase L1-like esterase